MNLFSSLRQTESSHVIFGKALQAVGLCLGLFLCLPAYSQNLGRISGIVTDSSGGAVVGTTVTVTDVSRGITRTVTADSTGTYSAPNLNPSTYTVHATYAGFKAFDRTDIAVGVGADVHVDVTLQPGDQTQTITVTEEAPQITTTNAQLGGTVAGQALVDLPMAGHDFLNLLSFNPGMQARPGGGAAAQQPISNGMRPEYNVFVFDGLADYTSYFPIAQPIAIGYSGGGPGQAVLIPSDSVQEFNVLENPKAEYGWRPGAQVSIGMKSGTNVLHGAAFALGRDQNLMARNPFFPTKTASSFENFGATIGGPIKKDKLFYLASYEGQNENIGNPKNVTVATTASGPGPASSLPDAINALMAQSITPNQLSLNLAGCVLGPLVQCTANQGLFSNNTQSTTFPINIPLTGGTNDGVAKVDYHLNDHNSFNAEYYGGRGFVLAPVANVTQPYWSGPLESISGVARAVWIWIPNSTMVNDVRFGWDHTTANNGASYDCDASSGAPNYAKLGLVSGATVCGLPTITITNIATLGGQGGTLTTSDTYRWLDTISYTHGNHIFKFGGEYALNTGFVALNVGNSKGAVTFNNTNPILNAFAGATPLENFLAGIATSGTIQVGTLPRNFKYNQFAGYAQDDWRILPRVTLNLGLRYEYTTPVHEDNGLLGNFDPSSPSGMRAQGTGGALTRLNPWALAPRFGVAWDVTGKGTTVVRSGLSISYNNPTTSVYFSPAAMLNFMPTGFIVQNAAGTKITTPNGNITTATFNINPTSIATDIPWGISPPTAPIFANYTGSLVTCSPATPCPIGGAAPHIPYPMTIAWNLGIQRAITNNISVDVNYVGNHGEHQFAFTDINQPLPGANGSAAEQTRRPYTLNGQFPWFAKMALLGSIGESSNYNGLQATLTERTSHGLTFRVGYTYAHAFDQGSSDFGMLLPQDSRNPAAEYGNGQYDIRHRLTFAPSYTIPGRKSFAQMLVGWQITSALTIDSGRPYNPTDAADDLSGTGEGQDRWTLVGNPQDFSGYGRHVAIPCYVAPTAVGNFAAKVNGQNVCTVGTAAQPLPQTCMTAAATEQPGPQGQTGTASLMKLGCYMAGSSVMVPPAVGTFGTMSRYEIFGPGFSEWDMSIIKTWKVKERLTAQFRAEIYNVVNSWQFASPTATLSTPATFGQSQATPDVGANNAIIGTGGPRKIQLGLRFTF